jgi:predicted Zn finger-like uncharacterized protein
MSLATRCSACGTMFRVVQDQLRVSEGWVRCGRCDTVFNALDALVDLEAEAAAAGSAPAQAPSDEAFYEPAGSPVDDEVEDGPHRRAAGADVHGHAGSASDPVEPEIARFDAEAGAERFHRPEPPEPVWIAEPPMPALAASVQAERPFSGSDGLLADPPIVAAQAAPVWRPANDEPVGTQRSAPGGPPQAPTPTFVRQAERDARWTSPAMRAALIGSTLILAGVLAMQAVYHFRDTVAASSPVADALLRSACARWGCRIEAPRRIEQVTLEGSGLSRVAQQPQAVKLAINLRNRAQTDLMMPSVDLSLTDAKGELIARRVLGPGDFRIDPPRIRRSAELPLELVLSTGERAIAGYTVELFYP